jgi:hypothetical protein
MLSQTLFAGKIENGYKALKIYNYFEAKRIFTKSMKKDSASCAFGLSTIFYRKDNPFHSLDSAYRYILIAERNFELTDKKLRTALMPYGFEQIELVRLRDSISSVFYSKAIEVNTIEAYNEFIKNHPFAQERFRALYKRDALIYEELKIKNQSALYKAFIDSNSSSHFIRLIQTEYELAIYRETTLSGEIADYNRFIELYPKNRYVKDAEDKIYELSTVYNTVEDYHKFIIKFPFNRNVEDAWRKLYQLYMIDYSDDRAIQFKEDFPDYPFQFELEKDIKYAKRELVPFKDGEYFGAMDYDGNVVLPANYDYLSFFKEGLALAVRNGRVGFIDKGNNIIIDFKYDEATEFEDGRSIVMLNDKYGVIDRSGKVLLPISFNDLGLYAEGLIYGLRDTLYAYYDKSGAIRIEEKFEEAYSFSNGKAKVQFEGKQTYIDIYGDFINEPVHTKLTPFTDSLFVFSDDDKFGICDFNGVPIDSIRYDVIGNLEEGLAIVSLGRKVGYVDSKGRLIIDLIYEEYPNFVEKGSFKSSMAIVSKNGKYGLIDKVGNQILPFKYLQIGAISYLTAFNKGKGWGFFDLNYDIKIKSTYDFAESFENGFALIQKGNKWGVIDTSGSEVIAPLYNEITRMLDFSFVVADSGKFGLFDLKGKELAPIIYDQIRLVKDDFILLLKEEELSYYQISIRKIIQPIKKEDE